MSAKIIKKTVYILNNTFFNQKSIANMVNNKRRIDIELYAT